MEVCFHDDEGNFTFAFDQVEDAFNAGFDHLMRFPFEQFRQAIEAGAKFRGEG